MAWSYRKKGKKRERSKRYTPGKPFQRGQWEDQRNEGEDDVKKDIQRLKVPNSKTFVQDRRRWKWMGRP